VIGLPAAAAGAYRQQSFDEHEAINANEHRETVHHHVSGLSVMIGAVVSMTTVLGIVGIVRNQCLFP
jgi:hypothetical protein